MNATEIKAIKNRMSELIAEVSELKDAIKVLTSGYNSAESKEPKVPSFNFLKAYEEYPRKQGKTQGLKKCRSEIKTPEDFELLLKSIRRYRDYIRLNGIEPAYVKHFNSFMSSWRDWLDSDVGNAAIMTPVTTETTAQYLARKEKERLRSEEEASETADPEKVKTLMKGLFK